MLDSDATLDRMTNSPGATLEGLLGTPQELLDLLPVAVWICRADGTLLRYNARAAELWQSHPVPGLSHSCNCTKGSIYLPDGTLLAHETTPMALALYNGIATTELDIFIERADGSRIPATVNATPLHDESGKIVGAIACYRDQSDRTALQESRRAEQSLRESQQRLAATYEHAGIGIAEVDAAGHLLRVNEACCTISGYSRAELVGMAFHQLTHPEDRPQEIELYRQQTDGHLDNYAMEKRYICKNGVLRWIAIHSSAVRATDGAFLYAVRILRDITARKQAQERQQMLMGELNHRIKNILATVQSIAYQTIRRTTDPQHFYEKFQGRLMALGKAHSLLTRSQWKGANLRDIIEEQALPFREGKGERILLSGDAVELSPDQAVVLGMVFHELLTNAVKHGSLSGLAGCVRIEWRLRDDLLPGQTWLQLHWHESDGAIIQPPHHLGFGSVFIERSVRDQLNGNVRMDYQPSGLVCLLELPLHS